MKQILFLLCVAAALLSCGKDDALDDSAKNLLNTTWYARTGETYTFTDHAAIGDRDFDLGEKTVKLISCFYFYGNGTGTRQLTYWAYNGKLTLWKNICDYASFNFTWTYGKGVVTITNDRDDAIIPKTSNLELILFQGDHYSVTYNGGGVTLWTDRAKVDDELK